MQRDPLGQHVLFLLWHANAHDAPFAQRLLTLALQLYALRPHIVRRAAAPTRSGRGAWR